MHRHAESMEKVIAAILVTEGQLSGIDAAAMVGVSPRRFRGIFVAHFGESFRVLRLRFRMEAARRRLLETSETIPAVSAQLGYSERDKLERTFKKQFQLTPAQFRKEHRKRIFKMTAQGMDREIEFR